MPYYVVENHQDWPSFTQAFGNGLSYTARHSTELPLFAFLNKVHHLTAILCTLESPRIGKFHQSDLKWSFIQCKTFNYLYF